MSAHDVLQPRPADEKKSGHLHGVLHRQVTHGADACVEVLPIVLLALLHEQDGEDDRQHVHVAGERLEPCVDVRPLAEGGVGLDVLWHGVGDAAPGEGGLGRPRIHPCLGGLTQHGAERRHQRLHVGGLHAPQLGLGDAHPPPDQLVAGIRIVGRDGRVGDVVPVGDGQILERHDPVVVAGAVRLMECDDLAHLMLLRMLSTKAVRRCLCPLVRR